MGFLLFLGLPHFLILHAGTNIVHYLIGGGELTMNKRTMGEGYNFSEYDFLSYG